MVYQPDGSLKPAKPDSKVIDLLRHTTGIEKYIPRAEKAI